MYTYTDSLAGKQTVKFDKLSEIVKYIEDFGHEGDEPSFGIVYHNDFPVLEYKSSPDGLEWFK